MNKFQSFSFRKAIILATLAWSAMFLLLPYINLIVMSMWDQNTGLTLAAYSALFTPQFAKVLLKSMRLSALASLTCLLVAYPFTWYMTQIKDLKAKVFLLFLTAVPFWTSSLLRLYGLRVLLGRHGLINTCLLRLKLIYSPIQFLYGDLAIVLGLVYLLLPFMILPLYSSMSRLDPAQLEAAEDLGASQAQVFYNIVLPQTWSAALSGLLMVFLPGLTLFYVSDILGGGKYVLLGNWIKTACLVLQQWDICAASSVGLLLSLNSAAYLWRQLVVQAAARRKAPYVV